MIEVALKLQNEFEHLLRLQWQQDVEVHINEYRSGYDITVLCCNDELSLEDELSFYKLFNKFEDEYPEISLEVMKFTYDEWNKMYGGVETND